jgi:hypothetical protein
VLTLPRRVAVPTDRLCASKCEALRAGGAAEQKVTVYSENTGVYVDYGIVIPVPTGAGRFI